MTSTAGPMSLLVVLVTIACAVADTGPAGVSGPQSGPVLGNPALPRFGTIRVAMEPAAVIKPEIPPARSSALMRTPPTSDFSHPPLEIDVTAVNRFPVTNFPRLAQSTAPSLFGDESDELFAPPNQAPPASPPASPHASPHASPPTPRDTKPPTVTPIEQLNFGPPPPASPQKSPSDAAGKGQAPTGQPPVADQVAGQKKDDIKKEDEGPVDLSVLSRSPLFSPDPCYENLPSDPAAEMNTYEGKYCFPTQRPWIELGRGFYTAGEIPPSPLFLGETNPVTPRFLLFGDYRTALGYANNGNASDKAVWAHQLNLDFDFKVTGTERFHAFWSPLDEDGLSSRVEADQDRFEIREAFDDDFDTFFFEGDMGAIVGGMNHQFMPFDMPFVVGKYPMLLQNGVWLFDVLEGFSMTIPARNNPQLDISNYDITTFVAFDDVDSPAFGRDDNAANLFGVHGFFDAANGYVEWGYGFLDDTTGLGRSYHSMCMSYSRRYWHRVSNAVRVMVNMGQNPAVGPETADGTLVLFENALITSNPNFFVPYMNFFAGMGRPQSLARAGGAGGVLFGTGINFESDNLTGFPTLDATAQNAYGGAMGINLIGANFSSQWIFELATVQTYGRIADQIATGDQYAAGIRYQLPINNAWLLRFDAIHGLREKADDVTGGRAELRWKF